MRTLHLISRLSFSDRVIGSFSEGRSTERFVLLTENCARLSGRATRGDELQIVTVGSQEYEGLLSAGFDVLWVHGAETLPIRFVNDYRGNALVVWSALGYDYRKYLGRWDSSVAATLRWMKRPALRTLIKRPSLCMIARMGLSSHMPSEHGRFFGRVDYFCVSRSRDEKAVGELLPRRTKAIRFSYCHDGGEDDPAKKTISAINRILREVVRNGAQAKGGWLDEGGEVIFHSNGGAGEPMESVKVRRQARLRLPVVTYLRPGYSFRGWSLSPKGVVLWPDGGCLAHPPFVNGKANLYAQWEGRPCRVVFSPNAGTGAMPDHLIVCGSWSALPLNKFVRPMYEFAGWAATAKGKVLWGNGGRIRNPPVVKNGKTVLYAQWRGLKFPVRFDANGGMGTMPVNFSFIYDAGNLLPANEFVRRGYEFIGWSSRPNGRVIWLDGAAIRKPPVYKGVVVLYAVWRSCAHRQFLLRFDANGGRGKMPDVWIRYGESFRLPKNGYVRPHFEFKGWANELEGPVRWLDQSELSEFSIRDGLIRLFAIWAGRSYKVQFEPNGGRGQMSAMHSVFGEATTLPRNAFVRKGCEFVGWSETPAGGDVVWLNEGKICRPTVKNGVARLFAQWKGWDCRVHFDANGGKGCMPEFAFRYKIGARIPKNRFVREGCEFVGWALQPVEKIVWADHQLIVRPPIRGGEVTLYAQWKGWPCRVKFNANGGEGQMSDFEFRYREWILLPRNEFTRSGYHFAGWMCSPAGENVCEDGGFICDQPVQQGVLKLFAKWEKD